MRWMLVLPVLSLALAMLWAQPLPPHSSRRARAIPDPQTRVAVPEPVEEVTEEIEEPEEEAEPEPGDSCWLDEWTNMQVIDARTAQPIEGAHASVILFDSFERQIQRGTTNAKGQVKVRTGCAPIVGMLVRKPGYQSRFMKLKYGESPKKVKLEPGVRVPGRVLDRGTPVAGARVYVWAEKRGVQLARDENHVSPYFDDYITTDSEGRFEIDGVPEGQPFIVAVVAPSRGAYHAVHRDTAPIEVHLGEGAVLEGFVFDRRGEPVAGAEVYVEREEKSGDYDFGILSREEVHSEAVTDANGRYRIRGIDAPGRFVVTASKDWSARGASAPVNLVGWNHCEWRDVRIEKCASLRVESHDYPNDEDGANLWIDCELVHLDGRSSWSRFWSNSSTSCGNGSYERSGIHAGTYRLTIDLNHKVVDTRVITLRPGEDKKLVLDPPTR